MLWNKLKCAIQLSRGEGQARLTPSHGLISHLSVSPKSRYTVWSIRLVDSQGDVIYERLDHTGRLDFFEEIPIGGSTAEEIKVHIFDATKNEEVNVMLKIKER